MQTAPANTSPGNQSERLWLFLFLAGALLLGTARWHFSNQSGGFTPGANRKTISGVTLPQLGGGEWRLDDHRGQVVLINYWATWCEPCQEELPGLMQVARESGPKGLAVVGVSMDDGPNAQATVQQFVTRFRIPYPIAFTTPTHGATRDMGIPTTILLDRQGRVVKTYSGAVEHRDFAKDIAALLAES